MRELVAVLVLLVAPSATRAFPEEGASPLLVSVAASLRDVASDIAADFRQVHPAVELAVNSGPSGLLARQIEDGAPVDVFISAGWPEVQRLQEKGLVSREPVVVAGNRLVVIVPASSPWISRTPEELLRADDLRRIATGDPAVVPFGHYAKQALTIAGLWDIVAPKAVFALDVRQALTYADQGSVDAAIVYATDARIARSARLLGTVPGSDHLRIEVVAACIARSRNDAGLEFLRYLREPAARAALIEHGFLPDP